MTGWWFLLIPLSMIVTGEVMRRRFNHEFHTEVTFWEVIRRVGQPPKRAETMESTRTCKRCGKRNVPLIEVAGSDCLLLAPHQDPMYLNQGLTGLAAQCFGTHTVDGGLA